MDNQIKAYLSLPGISVTKRKEIENRIKRGPRKWGPYLVAALLSNYDRTVKLDFRQIDSEDPVKAAISGLNSLTVALRRRNLRNELQAIWSKTTDPHIIYLARKSSHKLTPKQAEQMVYGEEK